MKNEIEAMITDITTTTAEAEDYTGEAEPAPPGAASSPPLGHASSCIL